MNISLNTNFATPMSIPYTNLQLIADAGFTHIHWSNHWNDDYLYGKYELAEIKRRLQETGLKLLDIHGSSGVEKAWFSENETCRKAGVELVANRLRLQRDLEGENVVMMHIPGNLEDTAEDQKEITKQRQDALKRSLTELMPIINETHVPLAVENLSWHQTSWNFIEELMAEFPADKLGICYDSGHDNFSKCALKYFRKNRNRITAVHLNDNDGKSDLHQPPFYGTVDWDIVTDILADSSYNALLSFELTIKNTPFMDPNFNITKQPLENYQHFLADAYKRCQKICIAVDRKRAHK